MARLLQRDTQAEKTPMIQPCNLIYFQSDNHNRNVLGCYDHPLVQTPTLDKIAASGTRFTNAYCASPLCCPSRAAIATGRYIYQTGFWDNAIVYDGSVPSWMHRIREQGHRVTSIGKLHFRSSEDDNGFTEELAAMHILNGKGGVSMLLRGLGDEQVNIGQWELYLEQSGGGGSHYQDFDRKVSDLAIDWLRRHARDQSKPWVLHVSYPSPHPPFSVPQRLYDLYPHEHIPLPPLFTVDERPEHPALQHLRHIMDTGVLDAESVRRISAGYFALITHLDEQIGRVLQAAEELDLLANTRLLYTSDHGEMHSSHGLLGKTCLYEGSIGVPLLMAGPDIPSAHTVEQIVSHVDLFPTLVESVGASLLDADQNLPGISLWPAMHGDEQSRIGFAEYHAAGSKNGSFMLRDGSLKLVYHVDMPPQLFDLTDDPLETRDLADKSAYASIVQKLTARLRTICDPEAVDRRAKADQRAKIEYWGGKEKILAEGMLVYTPPPGVAADIQGVV